MSKIDYEISSSSVEAIRDKIAYILADELENQYILSGDELFNAKVWLERFINFDKTEMPAINVYYVNSTSQEKTPNSSKLQSNFNIDIYTSAKATVQQRGDVKSAFLLHKLIMVVRFILENPNYLKLDFDSSFIYTTKVDSINISQPNNQDGTFTISASVKFIVEHEELNGQLVGVLGQIFNTKIKLNETDKGYYLSISN